MAEVSPDALRDPDFRAALLRFARDYRRFLASERSADLEPATRDLVAAQFEARERALAEWAADLKARHGAG